MRDFALYTLARLGLFALAFGLLWLVLSPVVTWTTVSVLWVAVLALLVSAVASLVLLGRLRDRLAASVQQRAQRVRDSVERSRHSEDVE